MSWCSNPQCQTTAGCVCGASFPTVSDFPTALRSPGPTFTTDNTSGPIDEITSLRAELAQARADRDEALKTVKRVQASARTLTAVQGQIYEHYRKNSAINHEAVTTLDSERQANAILTDQLDAATRRADELAAALEKLRETLKDVRERGLIYWEPNTERGHITKATMLARIDTVLSSTPAALAEYRAKVVQECAEIAKAVAESEEKAALAGVAESTGVGSRGWLKDAVHSHASETAGKIADAILALLQNAEG